MVLKIEQLDLFKTEPTKSIQNPLSRFKDQCDICKKFDYLYSWNNMCICSYCHMMLEREKQDGIRSASFTFNN